MVSLCSDRTCSRIKRWVFRLVLLWLLITMVKASLCHVYNASCQVYWYESVLAFVFGCFTSSWEERQPVYWPATRLVELTTSLSVCRWNWDPSLSLKYLTGSRESMICDFRRKISKFLSAEEYFFNLILLSFWTNDCVSKYLHKYN